MTLLEEFERDLARVTGQTSRNPPPKPNRGVLMQWLASRKEPLDEDDISLLADDLDLEGVERDMFEEEVGTWI